MKHLIQSELARFKNLALGFAVAHLLLLKGLSAFGDVFSPGIGQLAFGLLLATLPGLLFGLYQMGSYAKPNRWAYLIHRPLAPWKILVSLTSAAAILLAFAFTLPQLLMILYLDHFTGQWVDLRHYLLPLYLLGTILCFYLLGAYVVLSRSRIALLALCLPVFFLTRQAEGLWVFAPLAVVLLWSAFLVWSVFKPDLTTHPRRPWKLALGALPAQYALFWLLIAGSALAHQTLVIVGEVGWRSFAVFAWNDYFPEGTVQHAVYLNGEEALQNGLRGADTPRSRHLQKQIALTDVSNASPSIRKHPRRGQLMFQDRGGVLQDAEAEVIWTFSHDAMLFHGQDAKNGTAAGWLGTGGPREGALGEVPESERFAEVPMVFGGRFLATRHQLYEFDPLRRRMSLRFSVAEGEILAGPLTVHGVYATVPTSEALYFFEPRDLEKGPQALEPMAAVPLEDDLRNLGSIDVAELIDGYLVSFRFGDRSARGFGEGHQVIAEVGLDGESEVVADRQLTQGFPLWYEHRGFIFSPALQTFHDLAWAAIGPQRPNRVSLGDLLRHPVPASIAFLALVFALLSAALTFAFARQRGLGRAQRLAWTGAAFLLGVPAFVSFFFFTGKQESAAGVSRERPSVEGALGVAA